MVRPNPYRPYADVPNRPTPRWVPFSGLPCPHTRHAHTHPRHPHAPGVPYTRLAFLPPLVVASTAASFAPDELRAHAWRFGQFYLHSFICPDSILYRWQRLRIFLLFACAHHYLRYLCAYTHRTLFHTFTHCALPHRRVHATPAFIVRFILPSLSSCGADCLLRIRCLHFHVHYAPPDLHTPRFNVVYR